MRGHWITHAAHAYRDLSAVIFARWSVMKVSGITTKLPFGSRVSSAIAVSSSLTSRTLAMVPFTAKDAAAALNGFTK
jgi:hypothetical protein